LKSQIKLCLILIVTLVLTHTLMAQQPALQYFRQYDKEGLNVFGPSKMDTVPFSGIKIRVGAAVSEDFQVITDRNNATPVYVNGANINQLKNLNGAFNPALANVNLDAQLQDGIRVNLALYLSARDNHEVSFKDWYIQIDKIVFLKSDLIDTLMKRFTIKTGFYEMDYGDQHFRRTDGGNNIYNPFVENYIMDEFALETGTEIYYHPANGIIALAGMSNGELKPTVAAPIKIDSATGKLNFSAPAFHFKLGYDKQLNNNFRFRLTGSYYMDQSAVNNGLYYGDITGSHYVLVMENTSVSSDETTWSGKYDPQYSEQVNSLMINSFLKYKGLEFFGTYELARGRTITETSLRKSREYAADLIYRFPQKTEDFWVGLRYNSVISALPQYQNEITINREVCSIGWFTSKNIILKVEYVNQQYLNFATTDIRSGGKFSGFMVETAIGF
jgi:hypothetical protein